MFRVERLSVGYPKSENPPSNPAVSGRGTCEMAPCVFGGIDGKIRNKECGERGWALFLLLFLFEDDG